MITIIIKTDNAAFDDPEYGHEVARILDLMARDYKMYGQAKTQYNDVNGNRVVRLSDTKKGTR